MAVTCARTPDVETGTLAPKLSSKLSDKVQALQDVVTAEHARVQVIITQTAAAARQVESEATKYKRENAILIRRLDAIQQETALTRPTSPVPLSAVHAAQQRVSEAQSRTDSSVRISTSTFDWPISEHRGPGELLRLDYLGSRPKTAESIMAMKAPNRPNIHDGFKPDSAGREAEAVRGSFDVEVLEIPGQLHTQEVPPDVLRMTSNQAAAAAARRAAWARQQREGELTSDPGSSKTGRPSEKCSQITEDDIRGITKQKVSIKERMSKLVSTGSRVSLRSVGGNIFTRHSMAKRADRVHDAPSDVPNPRRLATLRTAKVFADADDMKEKVRQAVLQPEYDVTQLYHETGFYQSIAKHPGFEWVSLSAIILNSIWLAFETDHNDEALLINAHPFFQVVEQAFCLFFFLEWLVRYMSFRRKLDGLRDAWFCFDTVLVLLVVVETWGLSILFLVISTNGNRGVGTFSVFRLIRLFRLTRAARVARLLRAAPELMVIVKGLLVVMRTVVLIMCLLILLVYVFAIIFTQLAKNTGLGHQYYSTVSASMVTLTLGGILPDMWDITHTNANEHPLFALLFLIFVLMAFVTIMNMLVGVLVEVVGVVASVEKERNQVVSVKRRLRRLLLEANIPEDGSFGKREFTSLLENSKATKSMYDVGVDTVALVDFADYIFRNKEALSFADMLDIMLQLRGNNPARVKDIVDLRTSMNWELNRLEIQVEKLIDAVCPAEAESSLCGF